MKIDINKILKSDETLAAIYDSENKNSTYVLITKPYDKYTSFRISNHLNNSFYSNRTFKSNMKMYELMADIRIYLDDTKFYTFRYEDYFTLKILQTMPYDNFRFYIDNTMNIFDESKMGLVFYQTRYFNRNHKEFNIVSESFQKYLRKLFASGLINGYRQEDTEILVYVTGVGNAICDMYDSKYLEKFEKDKEKINIRYIEVPKNERI